MLTIDERIATARDRYYRAAKGQRSLWIEEIEAEKHPRAADGKWTGGPAASKVKVDMKHFGAGPWYGFATLPDGKQLTRSHPDQEEARRLLHADITAAGHEPDQEADQTDQTGPVADQTPLELPAEDVKENAEPESDQTHQEPDQAKIDARIAKAAARAGVPIPERPTWLKKKPGVALAADLAEKLNNGETIDKKALFDAANAAYGGTRAEGEYGQSEAYDAMESAVNRHIAAEKINPNVELEAGLENVSKLENIVNQLPTQTNRDGNKDLFQQFSTPPHYAYAAAWVAGIKPGDEVLEPSAGTGSLAVFAHNAGASLNLNELDPKRADYLRDQFQGAGVHVENAEQIAGILPKRGVPESDVVLMNPPFSQTAGRMGDKKELMTAAVHIEEAGQLLKQDGRLVSIVGRGMSPESERYKAWFKNMEAQGLHLRANVLVNGNVYKKYGTQFDSRLLVFDKTDKPLESPITGEVDSIQDLMAKLEGLKNERDTETAPADDSGTPSEPGSSSQVETDEGGSNAPDAIDATDAGSAAGTEPGRESQTESVTAQRGSGAGPIADAGDGLGNSSEQRIERAKARAAGGHGASSGVRTRRAGTANRAVDTDASGQPVGGQSSQQPGLVQREPVKLKLTPIESPADRAPTSEEDGEKNRELGSSLYDTYRPQRFNIEGAKAHPSPMVESSAMAAVLPPPATYEPTLSPDILTKGLMSDAQLESVVYAGQAHQDMLPGDAKVAARRRGYFIGDGTGAGKGRQIAGIMDDNWNQGRKKAVWVTKSGTLLEDSRRDWKGIGHNPDEVVPFSKMREAKQLPESGVAFLTYDTLKSKPRTQGKKDTLTSLVDWLGPDFDGVIAFDESHLMANATDQKGDRGVKEASQRALAGLDLQKLLPKARIVYASATGATEVENLAYADRLGIWGPGTAFPSREEFMQQMTAGGVAAMEACAQSLKAQGAYASRSLSLDDGTPEGKVTYDRLTHRLSDDQRETYNALADSWQAVLNNIDKALELTGGTESGAARSRASGQFWGAQQRFFDSVITSMQTPAVINAMEKDIAEGRAPVVQLVKTMESATKRAYAALGEDEEVSDMDVSPRDVLAQYLEHSFPTERWEEYMEGDKKRMRMVTTPARDHAGNILKDSRGNPILEPVHDPRAVKLKEALLDKVGAMHIPDSPIDMILNHFGHEKVAEATGRHLRKIWKDTDKGREQVVETRNPGSANTHEAAAFQNGSKDLLVFSEAGGTGRSYHASRRAKNQKQRVHYLLQPGWRADAAVQGLGRTHRTNQVSAPQYRLVEIGDLPGQRRFISTIARRLDQLGALTRGQRQTGSSGIFSSIDNLEGREAQHAVSRFFDELERGKIEGLNHTQVMQELGFAKQGDGEEALRKKNRQGEPQEIQMGQFLNRILSLRVDTQNKVFGAFENYLRQEVDRAEAEGTLDVGIENYKAHKITKKSDSVIHTDPISGAEVRHVIANVQDKIKKLTWNEVVDRDKQPSKFVRNTRSGQVWAVYPSLDKTNTTTGKIEPQYVLRGPNGNQYRSQLDVDHVGGFQKINETAAEKYWNEEHDRTPEFQNGEVHFLTGALLPVWNKIPGEQPRIRRVKFDDGRTMVGRQIPSNHVDEMLKRFGQSATSKKRDVSEIHAKLAAGTHTVLMSNGWEMKPVLLQGEPRIQLKGPGVSHLAELEGAGVKKERVQYDTRFYIPTGPRGVDVIRQLTANRPIAEVHEKYSRQTRSIEDRIEVARAMIATSTKPFVLSTIPFVSDASIQGVQKVDVYSRIELARSRVLRYSAVGWDATKHPRGQPQNKGEFAKSPGIAGQQMGLFGGD